MEEEEARDDDGKHASQHVGDYDEHGGACWDLGYLEGVAGHPAGAHGDDDGGRRCIEERVQEILVVAEAYAVANPVAMVIHLEHASVALAAVVSAVWLRPEASLAYAHSSILFSLYRERSSWSGGF